MTYVYILSDEEYGNYCATLDRSLVITMARNFSNSGNTKWTEEAVRGLEILLQRSDEDLASIGGGHGCHGSGYGGMILDVVTLVE